MSITIKDGGAYKTATKINVKVDGSYSPVSKVNVKENGYYKLAFSPDDETTDPISLLDSISIQNNIVISNSMEDERNDNIWGNGDNKDLDNNQICGSNFVTKVNILPYFEPQLNVTDVWLDSNNIVINGSTASISRKDIVTTQDEDGMDGAVNYLSAMTQELYDNIKISLLNNNIMISSNERSTKSVKKNSDDLYVPVADAEHINREDVANDRTGLVGAMSYFYAPIGAGVGFMRIYIVNHEYTVEVDYNLKLTHTPTGETRTINHKVTFKAYGSW